VDVWRPMSCLHRLPVFVPIGITTASVRVQSIKRSKQYFHKTECLLSSGLRDSRTLKRCKQACCGACALTSARDGFVISEDFSPPRPVHTSSSFSHSVGHGYQGHSVRCGRCTGPQKTIRPTTCMLVNTTYCRTRIGQFVGLLLHDVSVLSSCLLGLLCHLPRISLISLFWIQ
jgi:hypothetical protein